MTTTTAHATPHAPSAADRRGGPVGGGRPFAWLLVVTGAVGLLAAFVLAVEKIRLLEDPSYVPSCSINPVLSCGSVMRTDQASAFGFPNMYLGLAGYAVIAAIGAALLAGARMRPWFWACAQLGVLFGVGFIHWLVYESLYTIGALCPYCMVAWAATIPMFVYVTLHNLRHGVIPLGARGRRAVAAVLEFHWVIVVTWYLVIAMLVLTRFWSYWRTLL
ncbi:vitamin K epoxide reductase family protein [Streptomyces capparidis]